MATRILTVQPGDGYVNILTPGLIDPPLTPGGLYNAQVVSGAATMIHSEVQPSISTMGYFLDKFITLPFIIGVHPIWVKAIGGIPAVIAIEIKEDNKTSPLAIIKANQVKASTTLAVAASMGDTSVTVADTTGMAVEHYIGLFSLTTNTYSTATILTLPGANVVTFDTPLDHDYEIGDTFGSGITNMAVDGSSQTQIFSLRGADPGIKLATDVHRIMIYCLTTNTIDLSKFGDITALTKGVVIRRINGLTQNMLNWKTNFDIKKTMFDWESIADANPGLGQNGFFGRLTFKRLGSPQRIGPGDNIEVLIQDNLTVGGTILNLGVEFQGNIV